MEALAAFGLGGGVATFVSFLYDLTYNHASLGRIDERSDALLRLQVSFTSLPRYFETYHYLCLKQEMMEPGDERRAIKEQNATITLLLARTQAIMKELQRRLAKLAVIEGVDIATGKTVGRVKKAGRIAKSAAQRAMTDKTEVLEQRAEKNMASIKAWHEETLASFEAEELETLKAARRSRLNQAEEEKEKEKGKGKARAEDLGDNPGERVNNLIDQLSEPGQDKAAQMKKAEEEKENEKLGFWKGSVRSVKRSLRKKL